MEEMGEEDDNEARIFCGTCPDSHCGNVLYFMSKQSVGVDCTKCGQRHATGALLNIKETNSSSAAVGSLLKSMLLNNSRTRKGTELVKVRGLSNYHCKLVSPLLTYYGMDKNSGKAKLLSELKQPDVFDCSLFGNRAFLIEKEHLEIDGYGKDKTGSLSYLKDTLELINQANGGETLLVPLHTDGDGHCLVHAISKAVVGRELLWHSLRQNLRDHLEKENVQYQALFHDFIDQDEWNDIIAEADPDFHPETNEPFGLRNIHVFGLANVLHRPIILLDSTEGMQSSGDYSGIFLPVLCPVDKCKSQGVINKPLAIAWSSSARNHYVPLVGIKEVSLPKIPRLLLPKAWGVSNHLVSTYVDFDEHGCSMIGGSRSLPESYVERLVAAMDEVFYEKYQISPQLVADVNQFICKPSNAVGVSLVQVTEFTHQAVESGTLYRCLSCQAVKKLTKEQAPRSWRVPGGKFYKMVEETSTGLVSDAVYAFPEAEGEAFMYNAKEDMLKSIFAQQLMCDLCKGVLRQVHADGTVKYVNGDPTLTTTNTTRGSCSCGFKHYWDGEEYDNLPKSFSVPLEWNGKKVEEEISWFEMESDPSLNSNAYEIAIALVQKHFPGEFGSEVLVRKVVDKILQETAVKGSHKALPHVISTKDDEEMTIGHNEALPSKIILTGPKKKTFHKEELTKSECEELIRARTTHHAAYSQKRKSARESPEKAAGSSKLGKQEVPKGKEKAKPTSVSGANVPGNSEPRTVIGGPSKPRDRKIRLSSKDGKQATVTLNATATYGDLQEAVFAQLGIAKDRQKFRYGFPPRELLPPEDGNDVLPLTHGDRVSVEELPEKMDHQEQEIPPKNAPPSGVMETAAASWSDDEFEGLNREQFASELMSLFRGALNVDRWETMQHQPELFSCGGYIYEKVFKEVGPLRDDQHCSITELPGKTFAYNAKEDRFELCLGKVHIPVQPLDSASLARAHARTGTTQSLGPFHVSTSQDDEEQRLGAFSGALHHRDAAKGRSAFSGMGRTLGGSEKTEEEKKNSDGVIQMDVVSTQDITTHDKETGETTMASGSDNSSTQDTVRKLVEGEEAMTVDTEETKQIVSTDIEMKSSNAQESETIVDSVLPVVREVTTHEQKRMNVEQEGSNVMQSVASVTHEKLSVTPEETSAPEEMGGAGKAMSGGPEEMSGDSEATNGALKVMGSAPDETSGAPEETSSAPKAMSGAPEKTSSAPKEMSGAPEKTSSAPKEMSSAPEEMGGAPEETSSAPKEMSSVPEEISGAPKAMSSAPEEMGGAPEEIPVKMGGAPEEMSGAPEEIPVEMSGAPEEMSGAPEQIPVEMGGTSEEMSGAPEEISIVPEDTSGAPTDTGGAPEKASAMPKVTSGAHEKSSNVYGTSSTQHESSSIAQETQNTDHNFSSVKHEESTTINKTSNVTHEQPNTPQILSSHATSEGSRNSEPIVSEGLVSVADEENPPMDTTSADEREDIGHLGIMRDDGLKKGVGGDSSKDDDQIKGTPGDTSTDADQIKGTPGDTSLIGR